MDHRTSQTLTVGAAATVTGSSFLMDFNGNENNFAKHKNVPQQLVQFASNAAGATRYALDEDCALYEVGASPLYLASGGNPVQEFTAGTQTSGYTQTYCLVDPDTSVLSCGTSTQTPVQDYYCTSDFSGGGFAVLWYLGQQTSPNDCGTFTNSVVVVAD